MLKLSRKRSVKQETWTSTDFWVLRFWLY